MPSNVDDFLDPFELHARREPLPGAAVRVVVIDTRGDDTAAKVAESIVALLRQRGRVVESAVLEARSGGMASSLETVLISTTAPLVIMTTASQPWTESHLDPLLKAIDQCDHAV